MYVCMYVRHTLIVAWVMNVLGGAVSISYRACSLHAEVHILAVFAKYVAPPTKSMSTSMSSYGCQNARMRAAAKVSM